MQWKGKMNGVPVEGEIRQTTGIAQVHLTIKCYCKYWASAEYLVETMAEQDIWKYNTVGTTVELSAYIDADNETIDMLEKITIAIDTVLYAVFRAGRLEKDIDKKLYIGAKRASALLGTVIEGYKEYKY